jgi:hypothetical protein
LKNTITEKGWWSGSGVEPQGSRYCQKKKKKKKSLLTAKLDYRAKGIHKRISGRRKRLGSVSYSERS